VIVGEQPTQLLPKQLTTVALQLLPNNPLAPDRIKAIGKFERLSAAVELVRYLCDITYLFAI
jgi:hypothetical protein